MCAEIRLWIDDIFFLQLFEYAPFGHCEVFNCGTLLKVNAVVDKYTQHIWISAAQSSFQVKKEKINQIN